MIDTPLLTVDCVVFHDNGVVLIRRGCEPYMGWYALPGGFVEIGESVEQACIREMKEETGVEINRSELSLIGVYSDPNRDPRGHTVSVALMGYANIDKLRAGDDAASVEVIKDWRTVDVAFDHKQILKDAWSLKQMIEERKTK